MCAVAREEGDGGDLAVLGRLMLDDGDWGGGVAPWRTEVDGCDVFEAWET